MARTIPILLALLIFAAPPAFAEVDFDASTFGGLRARALGPATMSGRVAAVDAVADDPLTVYVGAASGGVWKSTDAALTFKPVFDDHPQSIGAIKIDPSNPDVVWVGTGEPWTRNTVSVGFGVYKTSDGGDNWEHVGLADTERISTIRVDPTNGDVVYVCATGHLWDANEERGLFKTSDGGKSWEKVLYVDADTGCADIDIDPQDPQVVYAAMWQFRRYPDFFTSGGPGSGLYKSSDRGKNWTRLENGLPKGELGRIAVAVAPSRPSTVYATVEAEEDGGLYRSDDLGRTWQKKNGERTMLTRPFYFSELVVDPTDFRRVYKPALTTVVSTDGGESFSSLLGGGFQFTGRPHGDHHAVWIHPKNPHEILLGTDGGLYVSYDRANHWRHVRTLPIAQFYHASHDNNWPYNVFGGLQDNQSWIAPSRQTGGIRYQDWDLIGTGDGFWVFADPNDSNILYSEYQGGQLLRVHRDLGEVKSIKPYPEKGQEELRFNWNSPIHLSPNDKATIYYGSQYLHRSRDRGDTWETISLDLTTDDPARQRQKESGGLTIDNSTAENNATLYAISESPQSPQVIWTGSDDGLVYVTRDGGGEWIRVPVPDLPANTWVSSISASPHDEATAFATFDGHRTGDMAIYVYRTDDYGATWTSLVTAEVEGYAWTVKQDPVNPELLYLGTEQGLYLSLNGGRKWARFKENLPKVAVHDIVIHPEEHDVILATHGRGIYIIDDVTPLRALTQEILDATVTLLPSRPSRMMIASQFVSFPPGEFVGETVPEAASITYYLKKRHLFGDFKIEILDQDDELITTVVGGKRKGLNRASWAMRLDPPKLPPATNLVFAFQGPKVLEGTYKVRLTKGKEVLAGEVELVADPRSPHSAEDRRLQQETALDIYHRLSDLTYLVETLLDLTSQGRDRADRLERRSDADKATVFAERLDDFRASLVSTSESGWLSGDEKLREHLGNLFGEVVRYEGRPSTSQMTRRDTLVAELEEVEGKVEDYLTSELAALNVLLEKRGLEPLARQSREDWEVAESRGSTASWSQLGAWRDFLTFAPFGL